MSSDLLHLRDVVFRWPSPSAFALEVTAFDVAEGESVLLLGESGAGKSTLLSIICGALEPQSGLVQVAGTDIFQLSVAQRDRFRAEHIGVIFQQFNLLPFGSVADNIALPLRFAPKRRSRVGEVSEEVQLLCQSLRLPDELIAAKAATLSMGQQQRVAVARALIGTPPLIIADEPTSALDCETQGKFLDLLFEQCAARGATLLMVSHDARLKPRFDRSVELSKIAKIARGAA